MFQLFTHDWIPNMRKIFILLLSLFPITAIAAPKEQKIEYVSSKCQVTPSIAFKNKKDGYPGKNSIASSNNLALPAGKSVYAPGQKVYIYGHVLDKNCVPVSDAIVEIWQAGVDGKY